MPTACRTVVALVALAVLTAPGSAAPRVPPALGGQGTSARATTVPPFAGASLAIDPSSWWMEDGSNASFTAAWVDVPAGCLLSPAWYRWSVDGGEVGGTLTAANASESEFGAPQVGTGVTVLEVRSAAVVRCGANQTAQVANASVNLTIASAVELDALAVAPDPLAPGEAALLVGTVTGGTAPYRLRVDWGDGNVTDANLSGPGPFQVPYRYEENGTFEPVVLATDDGGRTATGTPLEPAHVGSGFVSAIEPSASEAEVGVPTTFTVGTLHAPANYSSVSWCDGASASGSGGAGGLVFGCTFADAGTFQVGFEAVGSTSPYLVTSSTLDEPVVPPPTLGFPCAAPASEVGRPVDVEVSLSGGVPPFTVDWALVGTGTAGTVLEGSDGTFDIPLTPGRAGAMVVSVVASDALGVAAATATEPLEVAPELVVGARATAGLADGAIRFNVSGSAIEGVAPYGWAVVPAVPPANASNLSGGLALPGGFGWNATYLVEGTVGIAVVVVDALGAFAVENLSASAVAPLAVRAQAADAGPGEVNVTFTVVGGVAPYLYRWQSCSGTVWNGSSPTPGPFDLTEPTASAGFCTFELEVTDAFGVEVATAAGANLTAPTTTPSRTATPEGPTEALVGVVLILTATTAVVLWSRRRPSRPAPIPPDPVAVLREVIEASDGVDRGLVELLAEERGVPLETARACLERLKADGSVRSGRGADGEEVLAWSPPPLR